MAYQVFAAYYDRLMGEVDYRARAVYFAGLIRQFLRVPSCAQGRPLLLDLGCGTGSLTVELAGLGFDMIGADGSAEMLSAAFGKSGGGIQYICQEFTELDLYGTVDAAVCTLDCLNHVAAPEALDKTFERVGLFTNPGGLFLFDVNTPFKHREVLGDHTFVYDLEDLYCVWQNTTDKETLITDISLDFFIKKGKTYQRESESFQERAWSREFLEELLERHGYDVLAVYGGDTQTPLGEQDERAVYVAQRRP